MMFGGKKTRVSSFHTPSHMSLTDVDNDVDTSQKDIMSTKTDRSTDNRFGYQLPRKQDKIVNALSGPDQEKTLGPTTPTWRQFTQTTTFHGVKYMFQDSPRKTRRIAWTFCVCAAIAFFVGQVSYRVVEYFKYKTNISMKVTYSDSIPFPAVTVCNQNKFRITVAHEKGAYPYLNQFYSMNASEDGSQFKDKVQHLDTRNLFLDAAHEYQDLIDSCVWNGEQCSEGSFREVLTDEGICFTYNSNGSKQVTASGASHALRLIVNVEQYHHMRGPQKDAGVKILLHNHDEPPEMEDLGFVAAPGFHTLVAIKYSEVNNLPAPHGTCLNDTDNMALCKQKCKVAQFVSACGCKDIYMDPYVDDPKVPTCTIPQLFACHNAEITNATYRAQLKETTCQCPTKCRRSTFQATLSSALISRFNVDTMTLLNKTKKARAKKHFMHAREVAARMVPEYEEELKPFMISLKKSLTKATKSIGSALTQLRSDWASFFRDAGKMTNAEDMTAILEDKMNLYQNNEQLDGYGRSIMSMIQLLGLTQDEDDWLRTLTASCASNPDLNLYLGAGKCPGNPSPRETDCTEEIELDGLPGCPVHGGPDGDKTWECVCYLAENSQGANFSELLEFETIYNLTVYPLYANDMDKLEKISKHHSCLDLLRNATDLLITPYGSLEPLLAAFVNSPNAAAMASAGEALQTTAEGASLLTYKNIASTCWWFRTYYPGHDPPRKEGMDSSSEEEEEEDAEEIQREEERKFTSAYSKSIDVMYGLQWIQQNFADLTKKLVVLQKELVTKVKPVMAALQNYIDEKSTRLELAGNFSQPVFVKALRDVDDNSFDANEYLESIEFDVMIGLKSIKAIFKDLDDLMIPFMDDTHLVTNITFIKTALSLDHPAINYVLNLTGVSALKKVIGVEGSFVGLADLLIPIYTEPFEEMYKIREECSSLVEDSHELKEILDKFVESLEMEADFFLDNFLQVDLFYNELKYDTVEEQEAFPVLALFGEIGGFMGLLLGASMITACECIDYLFLKMISASDAKKIRKETDKKNRVHAFVKE